MVTRANIGFGLTEGAAEFLPGTIIVGGFAIFVHSQSSITDQVTCRKSFALGIAFFEGDKSFPIIDRFHGVVDAFRVVALIREKGTPLQREDLVGCGEDVNGNCGIHDVGLGGQLVEWQPGDAVHQHMAFVSPVVYWLEAEWTPRAQSGSLFGWFSLENLLFAKDFGLFCFVFAMTGMESRPM